MKTPNRPLESLLVCALAAGIGLASAKPERVLPQPEDPVILPTDEETAEANRKVRESTLRSLRDDDDGWDDLWVFLQKTRYPDYQFDPNNLEKDTDSDGMTDYEEMLLHRNANFREPVYTKEEQIARIREERRRAIENAGHVAEAEKKRRAELAPLIIPPLTTKDGRPASAAEVDAEKQEKLAALAARLRQDSVVGRQRAEALARRLGIDTKFTLPDGRVAAITEAPEGIPDFNVSNNATGADSISTDEVHTGGSAGLSLTGGGPTQPFTAAANNGTGKVRLSVANASPFTTGQSAVVTGSTVGAYNGKWTVLAVAPDTIDLDLAFTTTASGTVSAPVTVGLWDGGDVFSTHVEFTSGGLRITDRDGVSALGIQHHPTHVAGTIMNKGVNTLARGMAPSALLDAFDFDQDFSEMATAASSSALRLSNHSYGLQRGWGFLPVGGQNFLAWWGDTSVSATEDYRFGFYDAFAQTADVIGYGAPDYLTVWAAGNERGGSGQPGANPANGYYAWDGAAWQVSTLARPNDFANGGFDLLEGRGVAKNVLTVSAVEDIVGGYSSASGVVFSSFSSLGPPDDGRVKPDLAANGVALFSSTNTGAYASDSGTSMATPTVSGSLTLLREHWMTLFGSAPLRAATLKALAIHTTDEAGTSTGPDYRFGWGLMNTKSAAELLTAQHASGAALRHLKQTVLQNTDFIEFQVRALGGQPIKVTIVWTDPAGTVPPKAVDVDTDATRALVNDLDLRLFAGATGFFPWKLNPASPANAATRNSDNKRDNVEQVQVDAPAAGQVFTIRVTHKGTLKDDTGATAPQAVSMILSGVDADAAPDFRVHDISATGINKNTLTWSSVVGATYRIETSLDLSTGSWEELPGDYVATKEFTSAEVDNTTGENRRFWRIRRLP